MPPINDGGLKVVAHLRDGNLVKGYLNNPSVPSIDVVKQEEVSITESVEICQDGSGQIVHVPVESLKALFFVKRLEGRTNYREVNYFTIVPQIQGLWVRIKFYDQEATEGIVHNSIQFVVNPGFFLKPPDPLSNNEITYVVKSSLVEFRVLGVKSAY